MIVIEDSVVQINVYTDQDCPQIDVSNNENMIEASDFDDAPQIEVGDDEPDSNVIA
jgi:hypothetical protein